MAESKGKKIAFIHPDLGIGGAERLVIDLAVALTKQNHEILFITNHFDKNHAFPELQNGQFPVRVIGDWLPRSIYGKLQALCAYFRMIYLSIVYVLFMRKEDKVGLYFTDLIPAANPILKLARQKVIYYCHHPDLLASPPGGTLKRIYRKPLDWFEGKATGMADCILVNSKYTETVFRDTFPNIRQNTRILYPTIASSFRDVIKRLQPKPIGDVIPKIVSKSGEPVVFLSINRFHPAKKLELALLAMDELRDITTPEEWDRIFFILAGGFDPQSSINSRTFDHLMHIIKAKQLKQKIVLLKSPSDLTKAELLLSCSCLVYTPVNEHFGIVPCEAMSVRKPVIACNSGGPKETVKDNITGFLCEPNGKSLAEAMKKIIYEDVRKMGQLGYEHFESNFSITSFENTLNEIVDETLNKKLN